MNVPRIKKITVLSSMSVLAVAACADSDYNAKTTRVDAKNRIEKAQADIAANSPTINGIKETNRPSNINVRKGLFLGDTGYQASNGSPLPARFETEDGISISLGGEVNIEQFAQSIEKITGIQVDFSDISATPVYGEPSDGDGGEEGADDSTSSGDNNSSQSSSSGDNENSSTAPFISPIGRTFRVHHEGKLSDLLTKVANRMQSDWIYSGGRIQFLGPQTVTYTLWSLPVQTEANASVGGGSDSGLFGGSTPATVTSSMVFNYWETFEAGMEALMPNGGASYNVNTSSGTIVVTAPRSIHRRVQDFVELENRRMSRQVAVKLDVIAFTRTREDSKGTSINGLIEQSGRGFNLDILSPVNAVEDGISIDAGIVSGPLDGITNVITALSKSGEVSILTTSTMIASNNTPTPMSITNEQAYLAGTTTSDDGETESTEIQTGIVRSGLNAVVTPRIMSSGVVNLQYTLNLTELVDLVEFVAPDNSASVQLPNISSRNFMQTVNIKNGESLIIGSFDQQTSGNKSQGPFSPQFWGLGGNANFNMLDTKVMVVMTPVVIEAQNTPTRR